jgi:ferrous iron transport protein B
MGRRGVKGMSCCDTTTTVDIRDDEKRIVLAGNPNVGKSIFFHSFTGTYVTVSNYPGTTLEVSSGRFNGNVVIDTTGVYGVSSFNDEERVARDAILSADMVVNIVDCVHLERDLFLTQQIIDMGIPVLVALNMMDEARRNGINVDIDTLQRELGVPVIPTTAPTGEGIQEVKNSVSRARLGHSCIKDHRAVGLLERDIGSRAEAVLIAEGDEETAAQVGVEVLELRDEIYAVRRNHINSLIENVVTKQNQYTHFSRRLGRHMIRPLTGIPILLGALFLLYQFLGVFIAQTVVGITEEAFFIGLYEPFVRRLVDSLISPGTFFNELLVGEFGVLSMAVTYTFGLLLPLVTGFYFFLALMEDSGYMPRVAVLADRSMNKLGLNGRAVIPMLLGFGCVTMATITTRLLGSTREKVIAVFLLGLAIPCSAQLGVIAGLIAPLGLSYFILYGVVILSVYVLAGTALHTILPGKSTDLMIDLPTLRIPRIRNVGKKTLIKSFHFIKEAGPIFAGGAVLISVLRRLGILSAIQEGIKPITERWLHLPEEAARAFIMGIVRRDFGAAGLNNLSLTPDQIVVALITITLFVPCIAAMMIMIKERNWKQALAIWFGSWITAFVVGGGVAKLLLVF